MRIGQLCLLPYFRPGDKALAEAVGAKAATHKAMLLAHHGLIVCGTDLDKAVARAEELEQTAKLFLLLQGKPYRSLSQAQIKDLISS
jgi:ribulose-5-phosphate 4-epimerase/fuculose-1-phosphate aldolase